MQMPWATQEKEQTAKRAVKQWQSFLTTTGMVKQEVVVDGYFGPKTQEATCDFQRAVGLEPTGVVDPPTLQKAQEALQQKGAVRPPQEAPAAPEPPAAVEPPADLAAVADAGTAGREFEIGPDEDKDLRESRPYFLVPMLELATPEIHERIIRRVGSAAEAAKQQNRPVTDLFVISHGWHRNFFDAASAYDRLLSRFVLLKHRRRLAGCQNVNPLILCLHWHSDPGQDNWVDPAGRRSKEDFVASACEKFEPKQGADRIVSNDFEDIFQLLSELAAPGVSPFDPQFDQRSADYLAYLEHYEIREADEASVPEKSAVLWRCFQEAAPRKPVDDQTERPNRFRNFKDAILSIVNFAVAAAGLLTVLGLVTRVLPPFESWPGAGYVIDLWERWRLLVDQRVADPAAGFGPSALHYLVLVGCPLAVSALIGWVYLKFAADSTESRDGSTGGHAPYPALLAWLPLQLLAIAPALLFLFITLLFGRALSLFGSNGRVIGLYDERDGDRDQDNPPATPSPWLRWGLFEMARKPAALLRRAVPSTSGVHSLAAALDKQLAFLDMQKKGVQTGREAAAFLADVMAACPDLRDARVHLIGHSFGCLVVSNMLRRLALDSGVRGRFRTDREDRRVQSVCMLEAAIASNWYEGEPRVLDMVRGGLSSIYSRYDTACGFFYPVANNSRLAAGSVGLYGGTTFAAEQRRKFVSLVTTPNLDDAQFGGTGATPSGGKMRVLNLDGSRMIYEGPPPSGGAHTDIFKEDVIQLCWAATLSFGHGLPPPIRRSAAGNPLLEVTPARQAAPAVVVDPGATGAAEGAESRARI